MVKRTMKKQQLVIFLLLKNSLHCHLRAFLSQFLCFRTYSYQCTDYITHVFTP